MNIKTIFNKISIISLIGATFLSSCLKDDAYVDFSKVGTLVELPLAAFNPNAAGDKFVVLSYAADLTNVDHPVVVNVASPEPLGSSLAVTLKVDDAALTAYNAAHATTYTLLPTTAYAIPSLTVTVPAGQRTSTMTVKFNPSAITDFTLQYVLPISIADASGQKISNYKTVYYVVGVKNQYDGVYTTNGVALRAGDPVLSGAFPERKYSLITSGPNSVQMSENPVWASGGPVGGIGPWIFTVDPATNLVTITDNANPVVVNNPANPNNYDPATKTFNISGYWGAGPTNRAWKATFVYSGPR
ncbi:MAG: DUF1735 domain-containing protein [Flavobacterium sp.]|nr:DUF1735 domain-containing protein [Pedobacter sp.]